MGWRVIGSERTGRRMTNSFRQRIDACKSRKGELLLMELEDYNPFLSFELLNLSEKRKFIQTLNGEIKNFTNY